MSSQVKWDGLREFQEALRNLPADLTGEASHIVEGAANGAMAEMKRGYPPGELNDGVTKTHFDSGRFSTGVIVKNRSKLGYLWDNGSEARHYITQGGKKHPTGKMWGRRPAPHTFVRAVMAARRLMWMQLIDMVERHGLVAKGNVGQL